MRMILLFTIVILTGSCVPANKTAPEQDSKPEAMAGQWELVGDAVNEPGWDIWGSSPVITDDGKVHLFVARWPGKYPFDPAWRIHSEIARYTGDSPEGPFKYQETVLKGNGKGWDAQGYHNPNIQRIGKCFALTCIANSGKGDTKGHPANQRIGIWIADSIEGPWKPAHGDPDRPMLEPPADPNHWCHGSRNGVANPALHQMADGSLYLYFKANRVPKDGHRGGTTMGVAIARQLEGPYIIQDEPATANDRHIEDGYAFHWRGQVCLMTTDNFGIIERGGGLLWPSIDGMKFDAPLPAYHNFGNYYFPDGIPASIQHHYTKAVKCERPQILMIEGEPAYLYAPSGTAIDGSDGTNCYVFRRKVKSEPEK